jgi:iron(III) transport system ATP-binding protein
MTASPVVEAHEAAVPVLGTRGLAKAFGGVQAVEAFDLEVHDGEILALLGPSGCGKTTALRLIAGLERPDAGTVAIRGRRVAGEGDWTPPERRRVGLVFQDWALFPHLDVRANVAFGLDRPSPDRIEELLELVHLRGLADRMPHELSGGQQQRVAVARALAPEPDLLLLDEPFSNLDAQLRASVRNEVREVIRATGTTAVLVTHDQEEALSVADRVAVMLHGRVRQIGTPFEVYSAPADGRVARLLGDANLLPATSRDGRVTFAFGAVDAALPDGPCEVLVRPESLRVLADRDGTGRVVHVEFYGHDQLVRCDLSDGVGVDVRLIGPHPEFARGTCVRLELAGPAIALPVRA